MRSFYEILNESKDYKIVKWYKSGEKESQSEEDKLLSLPVVSSKYYYELWKKLTESMLEADKREVKYIVYRETDSLVGFSNDIVIFKYVDVEDPIIGYQNSTRNKMYTADKSINAIDPFYFRKSSYDNGYKWDISFVVGISLNVKIDNAKSYHSIVDKYAKENNLLYEIHKGGSFTIEPLRTRRVEIVLYPMEMRGALTGQKFGI